MFQVGVALPEGAIAGSMGASVIIVGALLVGLAGVTVNVGGIAGALLVGIAGGKLDSLLTRSMERRNSGAS